MPASVSTVSRLSPTTETLAAVIRKVQTSTVKPQTYPLSFLGHLVFHSLKNNTLPNEQLEGRHLLLFHAGASAEITNPIELALGFAFLDTNERQRTAALFWFNQSDPLCQDAGSAFIQSAITQIFHFAEALPNAPPEGPSTQVFFTSIDSWYIPAIKQLCDLTFECQPHHALVFTATTQSSGSDVIETNHTAVSHLNQISLEIGARFVVNGEAFVLDKATLKDLDVVVQNNKYPYYRPYIERILKDEIIGKLARVVRALPSIDEGVPCPEDLSDLPAVSWCFVHYGFAVGINWTMPAFRRKGLAVYCTAAVTKAYRDFITSPAMTEMLDSLNMPHADLQNPQEFNTLVPHCYTQVNNEASVPLFGKIGYEVCHELAVDWLIGSLKEKQLRQ